jgi:hypothetical protein
MPETPTMSSPVILPARSNLSPAQRRALRAVAALIIPADAALGMPGADDVRILSADGHELRNASRHLLYK